MFYLGGFMLHRAIFGLGILTALFGFAASAHAADCITLNEDRQECGGGSCPPGQYCGKVAVVDYGWCAIPFAPFVLPCVQTQIECYCKINWYTPAGSALSAEILETIYLSPDSDPRAVEHIARGGAIVDADDFETKLLEAMKNASFE